MENSQPIHGYYSHNFHLESNKIFYMLFNQQPFLIQYDNILLRYLMNDKNRITLKYYFC